MDHPLYAWIIFNAAVFAILVADLMLFHRRPRVMLIREALAWSGAWIGLALFFNVLVYFLYAKHLLGFGVAHPHDISGPDAALQFLTGYVIELSLSVDNLFVFLAIFHYFKVHRHHQHHVLFWGIIGAVVLRATMILVGVAAIHRFEWLLYVLGAFLVFTGVKLCFQDSSEVDPEHNFVLRFARKILPISKAPHEGKFFTRENGKRIATSLILVLIVVETTDVVFALDSIPAVLAITKDPFIAYTSNIMAILGLRAMYFALAGLMGLFAYLRFGLAAVLAFIGVKMLLPLINVPDIPIGVALGVVAGTLAASVIASVIWPPKQAASASPPLDTDH